ncbi:hypothetical protein ACQKM2_15495 [Streptomyces sp. NPDC004126]|uniref:hypothetical protein n=1 Tax=Streptomyces sp. NPDC004126 TaxID=3390695 RepID=UPI003CFFD581
MLDEFLIDVATTGGVLGAGAELSPQEWRVRLGGAPLWVGETALGLVQDYGLIEVHHLRGEEDGTWRPFGFVIRVDRAGLTVAEVPPRIAAAYGVVSGPAGFAPVRAGIEAAGHALDPYVEWDSDAAAGIVRFRVPETGVGITVTERADGREGRSDGQICRVSRFRDFGQDPGGDRRRDAAR